jgi:hypothetical protein
MMKTFIGFSVPAYARHFGERDDRRNSERSSDPLVRLVVQRACVADMH